MNKKKLYRYLFLDRDGVINVERPNDYVKNIDEFEFIEGSLSAISFLSEYFEEIFIITNQRGIGKVIMSLSDVHDIHRYMIDEIGKNGGKVSNIYFCPDIDSTSINRKPNIGMAFQAQRDYPYVNFNEAVMVGNSMSDIQFGNKLGMCTILVGDKYEKDNAIYDLVNGYYENLHKFAEDIENKSRL